MNTIETDTDRFLADVLARIDSQPQADDNPDERADDPCAETDEGDY